MLAAADGYSYLHLPIVAGIIVFAVGMKVTIADVGGVLPDAARLALAGGLALYLAGNIAFRLRLTGLRSYACLGGIGALLVLSALAGNASALWVTSLAAAVIAAVCAVESWWAAEDRSDPRHATSR